jgi:hypothetical protein
MRTSVLKLKMPFSLALALAGLGIITACVTGLLTM